MVSTNYRIVWSGVQGMEGRDFTCAFCGREVASIAGWSGRGEHLNSQGGLSGHDGSSVYRIAVCPRCGNPTYLVNDRQVPGAPYGDVVDHLPEDVARLYDEARRCMSESAHNAAVMVGRKLLMNVAAARGAKEGSSFKAYVDFLERQNVVTPDMKPWVDEIRELGNDANHELPDVTRDEADALITFVSMLLKIVYEYPERGRRSVAARAAKAQGG